MSFSEQLDIAVERQRKTGDFWERWSLILAQLPECFAISANADNSASLYYQQWVANEDDSSSLRSTLVFGSIEKSASLLGMVRFCKVLQAYGMPLKSSVQMYRVCIPIA